LNDHIKGVTVALVLVCVAAIGVAFASSMKGKNAGREIGRLKGQIQQLARDKNSAEKSLAQLQAKYDEEFSLNENLQQALAQERLKNQTFADERQQRQRQKQAQRTTGDVKPTLTASPAQAATAAFNSVAQKRPGTQNFSSNKSD